MIMISSLGYRTRLIVKDLGQCSTGVGNAGEWHPYTPAQHHDRNTESMMSVHYR